jgi:predicted Zn-dependent peptidase
MSRLGKGELTHGEILSPDEIVERIDAVTAEDIHTLAREFLGGKPWALSVIGPPEVSGLDEFVHAPPGR